MSESDLPQAAITAMHEAFGPHPGRVVHVKGGWAEGTFTGTPEGSALCRAPFLAGRPVRALVRFSNGGGNPDAHDGDRGGRGIAVKLYLDDDTRTDLLGISVPFFTARTPEDFVDYVKLARRDPDTGQPDMAAIGAFLEQHPEMSYDALVTELHDATGNWVRTRWVPDAGEELLTDEDAQSRDRDYLAHDLRARLGRAPASFTLLARIAEAGDPIDDPTAPWPEERAAIAVGRLQVERAIEPAETERDIRVFDPTRVCDGIELSDDPILRFRPKVYDLSARGRWSQA